MTLAQRVCVCSSRHFTIVESCRKEQNWPIYNVLYIYGSEARFFNSEELSQIQSSPLLPQLPGPGRGGVNSTHLFGPMNSSKISPQVFFTIPYKSDDVVTQLNCLHFGRILPAIFCDISPPPPPPNTFGEFFISRIFCFFSDIKCVQYRALEF